MAAYEVLILHDTGNTGPGDVIASGFTDLTQDGKFNAPTMTVRTDAPFPAKTFSGPDTDVTHWDGVSVYSEIAKPYDVTTRFAEFNSITKVYDIKFIGESSSPFFVWGAGTIQNSTTDRFLTPGFENGAAPTSPIQFNIPRDVTLRKMFIRCATAPGNGNNVVYTTFINGLSTALSITLASDVISGSNFVDEVSAVSGDFIDIKVTKASNIGSSPQNVLCVMQVF